MNSHEEPIFQELNRRAVKSVATESVVRAYKEYLVFAITEFPCAPTVVSNPSKSLLIVFVVPICFMVSHV